MNEIFQKYLEDGILNANCIYQQSVKAEITDATNILNALVINLVAPLPPVKQNGHNQNFH